MYYDDFMIGFLINNPSPAVDGEPFLKSVEVGPWPDKTGWSTRYAGTSGCCDAAWSDYTTEDKREWLRRFYLDLLLVEGIPQADLDSEFSKIGYWNPNLLRTNDEI